MSSQNFSRQSKTPKKERAKFFFAGVRRHFETMATFFALVVAMTFSQSAMSSSNEDMLEENRELQDVLAALPKPLRPWVKAEFSSLKRSHCVPRASDQGVTICNWPTRLELSIDKTAERFQFFLVLQKKALVLLPGSEARWPLEVKSNGKAALVVEKGGRPYTQLREGAHVLSGRFLWDQPPELMQLPKNVGQVRLKLRGKKQPFPVIDNEGKLWLQKRVEEAKEKNALSL
ncbi:MAG: hypothetical protein GY822_05890 [Deltaproteobacteria bacterium]|nr:hypothetical protein [Deltaproteobacteria bacterium]